MSRLTQIQFKAFAEMIALIEDEEQRESQITFILPILKASNERFSEIRFREHISRKVSQNGLELEDMNRQQE